MSGRSKAQRGIVAGKLRRPHADAVRAQIQATMLVRRLEQHAAGKLDLSPTQVRAVEVLLRKVLPDLQSSELHHHDETAHASEAELLDKLRAMLTALPAEVRALVVAETQIDAAKVQ